MTLLYCLAVFVGSCLLFLAEPMCAKMVLPLLGGTPAVWNTCMVFFQAGLLAGYAYAHYAPARLGLRLHALLHLGVLALVAFTLPIALPTDVPETWHPVAWLLVALTRAVGFPFLLVAAGAPLLQRWFAASLPAGRADPYFLYAASNLGSFAGLIAYPLLVEPGLTLADQARFWLAGYFLLLGLTALCFPRKTRQPEMVADVPPSSAPIAPPTSLWRQRLRWSVLALVPSSLMLSVTAYLTTDIAPVPLLWVIPIGLYLLTFVVAFSGRPLLPHAFVLHWAPMVVIVVVIVLLLEATDPLALVLGVHLFALFWLGLACHGELAQTRPPADRLTEFFLCLAIGGALGGMFNGLLAPLVFSRLTEYPLMLVLVAFLCGLPRAGRPSRADVAWAVALGLFTAALLLAIRARLINVDAGRTTVLAVFVAPLLLVYAGRERPWRFALGLSAILLASGLYEGVHGTPVHRERSYFGVHLVADRDDLRRLVNGVTVHGMQSLRPDEAAIPLTYYHPSGPIGELMKDLAGDKRLDRVGLIGLGAGSLAFYSRTGQHWTFFEIDPSVIHIARNPNLFTFLSGAAGAVDIVEGDGRLQLARSGERFGLLIVDAFGSDAIPVHLLTRQAMQVYLTHLEPDGILVFHISNRYLDLEPVLGNLTREMPSEALPKLCCYVRDDRSAKDQAPGVYASIWAVLARRKADLPAGLFAPGTHWRPARTRGDLRDWTDDFSNIWQVFSWKGLEE
jgi:hypothetical protein